MIRYETRCPGQVCQGTGHGGHAAVILHGQKAPARAGSDVRFGVPWPVKVTVPVMLRSFWTTGSAWAASCTQTHKNAHRNTGSQHCIRLTQRLPLPPRGFSTPGTT
jgi:hypothetical protein